MGALSRNYFDILVWMKRVIRSAETIQQYVSARNLFRNWSNVYYFKNSNSSFQDYETLQMLLTIQLHNIYEESKKKQKAAYDDASELGRRISAVSGWKEGTDTENPESAIPPPPETPPLRFIKEGSIQGN